MDSPLQTSSILSKCILSETRFDFCIGMALGMVTQLPEEADEHSVTMRQLLAKLDVTSSATFFQEKKVKDGLGRRCPNTIESDVLPVRLPPVAPGHQLLISGLGRPLLSH